MSSCAIVTAEEIERFAREAIVASFWNGTFFGVAVCIAVATLFVLFWYRRFIVGSLYGLSVLALLFIFFVANAFARACVSSGIDETYFLGLDMILLALLIGAIIVRDRPFIINRNSS